MRIHETKRANIRPELKFPLAACQSLSDLALTSWSVCANSGCCTVAVVAMGSAFVPALSSRSLGPHRFRTFPNVVRCVARTSAAVSTRADVKSRAIREAFLSFYEAKGHSRIPSASLVPDDPSIMLTIAGMVPFKRYFMGVQNAPCLRATSAQKCIRTNDIENVGVTKRHHTFFEMLGNFSFGDYFKHQAIQWAWELLTKVYNIPVHRLAVSVFEDDDEALEIWRDVVRVPEHRIVRMGASDNFWAAGATGPCGPCSEIYYDFDPSSTTPVDLDDDNRFIELYNLVFMQYSRDSEGRLSPLAKRNIDTGMGLERMAQVLQNVPNNYETDLIRPLIDKVEQIARLDFESTTPSQQVSFKVVADHIRAVAHLISDGVLPSNIGRGYIVRRLIRRIVRHGRLLTIEQPFMADLIPTVARLAGEAGLNDISSGVSRIKQVVATEEKRFLQTLIRGEEQLDEVLAKVRADPNSTAISGEDAFELYDTFGFPLELTEEIARENGFSVDQVGFEQCMQEQKERARGARDAVSATTELSAAIAEAAEFAGATAFSGHDKTVLSGAEISAIVLADSAAVAETATKGDQVRLLLNETPFYAEGGGQVGDTGVMEVGEAIVRITDTVKEAGAHVHIGEVVSGQVATGQQAKASVNEPARRRIRAHHTATHLLQAALKEVVSESGISQAGSLVDSDRLRFDFNCPRALSAAELTDVENLINEWIEQAHDTVVSEMSLDEARKAGAVAMFGEKYDADRVRVVDVPGVSMELCGGTHVANTADIGLFKIIGESGPSAGVRRIEAVCGAAVLPYLSVRDDAVRQLSASLKAKPEELPRRVTALQEELKGKTKELDAALGELAVARAMSLVESCITMPNGTFVVAKMDGEVSSDSLKVAAERVGQKLGDSSAVVLASVAGDKVSFAAALGKEAHTTRGLHAGQLVGKIAKLCGGGGGGRANIAQAGGRDATKVAEALGTARSMLEDAFRQS